MTWLTRSSEYTEALTAHRFSPSKSVATFTHTETAQPIGPSPASLGRDFYAMPQQYQTAAYHFVERTVQRAAATVASWTGKPVEVMTGHFRPGRGHLYISSGAILEYGTDPDAAADYATGKLLIAASQREYLTATETKECEMRVSMYLRYGKEPDPARNYAAAHLARTVATLRGRESVLSEWPGWAGFFRCAEADRAPDETAAAFVSNTQAPAIVRAAYALSREAEGLQAVPLPPDVAAMVDLGRPHLEKKWTKGTMLERADAAVAAMLPPESAEQQSDTGAEADQADGNGEPQEGDAEPIPMPTEMGTPHQPNYSEAVATNTRTEPRKPSVPGTGMGTPGKGNRKYLVQEIAAGAASEAARQNMIETARPLIAALSRIAWETDSPPEADRAQERGDLDEGAMFRLAAFRDPRIFQKQQEQGRATVAVHIVVDCSGSMGAGIDGDHTRISASRAVAYALATAFGSSPRFRVAVSGHDVRYHTSYGGPRVMFYRCAAPQMIAGLEAHGDNADGYAIEHAARLVEREQADRRMVFLIADGQPSAEGYSQPAKHIRSVIESAARRGIDFLAVGIEGTIRQSVGRNLFGSRFVSLDATRTAGPLLARTISRLAKGGIA